MAEHDHDGTPALAFVAEHFQLIKQELRKRFPRAKFCDDEIRSIGVLVYEEHRRKRNQFNAAKDTTSYWYWLRKYLQKTPQIDIVETEYRDDDHPAAPSDGSGDALLDSVSCARYDENGVFDCDVTDADSGETYHSNVPAAYICAESFLRFDLRKACHDAVVDLAECESPGAAVERLKQQYGRGKITALAQVLRECVFGEVRRLGLSVYRVECRNGSLNIVITCGSSPKDVISFLSCHKQFGAPLHCEEIAYTPAASASQCSPTHRRRRGPQTPGSSHGEVQTTPQLH